MATNDKYDRQLRLWGADGQAALGNTCVILVNASAVGTETLKNLVLPGVGAFQVVSEGVTSAQHTNSNFFITHDPNSPSTMAEVACKLLQELNPDVSGSHLSVDSLTDVDYNTLLQSTGKQKVLVVASDVEPQVLDKIAEATFEMGVPLIVTYSYGLIGTVRLQSGPLPILQPKPRSSRPDLRLDCPFPALQALADSIQWNQLESHEHSHVPYPLILLNVAKEYKASKGSMPSNFAEKQDFQNMIKSMSRDFNMEENFGQAYKHAYLAYSPLQLDLDHLGSIRDTSKTCYPELYKLLVGLEQFVSKNGVAPLSGIIPDMVSSTKSYLQLQTCYQEQAQLDWKEMRVFVDASVPDEKLVIFIQNVHHIELLQVRSLADTASGLNPDLIDNLRMSLMEAEEAPEQCPLIWYLGLEGCHLFHRNNGRYPGTNEDYASDVPLLQDCISQVAAQVAVSDNETIQNVFKDGRVAAELVRYANAEIHNIASVLGGVASQEAVKVITGQYIPINNTYVYNGIVSSGAVYQM